MIRLKTKLGFEWGRKDVSVVEKDPRRIKLTILFEVQVSSHLPLYILRSLNRKVHSQKLISGVLVYDWTSPFCLSLSHLFAFVKTIGNEGCVL